MKPTIPRHALATLAAAAALCAIHAAPALAQPCTPQWEGGFARFEPDGQINSLVVFDDGSGPVLWVSGAFTQIGETPSLRIAKLRCLHSSCAGDITSDGVVDMLDLNALLTTYGQANQSGSGAYISGDLDFSGRVDFRDLNTLLALFGSNCP